MKLTQTVSAMERTLPFLRSLAAALFAVCLLAVGANRLFADDPPAKPTLEDATAPPSNEADTPDSETPGQKLALFLKVQSPLGDAQFARVRNAALNLQSEAERRGQSAVLVLEITPGTSPFYQVQGLARFLTSTEISAVNTVAWIPEDVTGNNVVLALGCREIIMHPDAELGDIGRGQPLDRDEESDIISLVQKAHNPKVNEAVARKMIDPSVSLLKVKYRQTKDGPEQTEIITNNRLRVLQETKATVEPRTLLDAGMKGVFTGKTARDWDVLVTQTAESRSELAELYELPKSALREVATLGGELKVRLLRIDGVIDGPQAAFIKRQVQRALGQGANLLIFEVDSPGGRLDAMQEIAYTISDLDPDTVRTVAYVPQDAISAAAVISLACDELYMEPHAKIGDAGPIEMRPGEAFEHAPEKIVSYMRKLMQELAEKKNRPAAIMKSMVDRNLEVYEVTNRDTGAVWFMTEDEIHASNGEWIRGAIVPESRNGLLLTIFGTEAHKYKLAEPAVADESELKERLGIPADQKLIPMKETWVDSMVFNLNNPAWTGTLLTLAMVCLFIELHFMTGVMAIGSALFFALFFWSKYMGGTAGWLEVILFAFGLILMALEIFVMPGFGVFGISGGVLLLMSVVMASQTFGHSEPGRDMVLLARNLTTVSLSIGAVILIAVVLNRFLPHMPIMGAMILTPPGSTATADGPQLRPDLINDPHGSGMVGLTGRAQTTLRPAGKALLDGRLVDVVSDGGYIDTGTPIEVVRVEGNRVIVREA